MYKSEWENITSRLAPSNGGAVEQIIQLARKAADEVLSCLPGMWSGDEGKRKAGLQKSREAAGQLIAAVRGISSSAVIREIHKLRTAYEEELSRLPEGESLFRIGLEALSELEGAYDNLLRHQAIERVPGLVAPALRLGEFHSSLAASRSLFSVQRETPDSGQMQVVIEIGGVTTVAALSDWMISLRVFFRIAEEIDQGENPDAAPVEESLRLVRIESGSPIRITLEGAERAMLRFLTLVKVGVRSVFRLCTPEGRIRDRLALLQEFRAAGLPIPPEAETELTKALVGSMERLNLAVSEGRGAAITIEGERIEPTMSEFPALSSESHSSPAGKSPPRLRGPGL